MSTTVAICIVSATGLLALPTAEVTLAWTHSVERVRWEEDYRAEAGGLRAVESRVQGSGAGMEPADGAVLSGGWWRYRPALPILSELRLARSEFAGDYELCWGGVCRGLSALAPADSGVTELRACSRS